MAGFWAHFSMRPPEPRSTTAGRVLAIALMWVCSGCLAPNEDFDQALVEGADCDVDDAHPNHTLGDAAPLGAIPERADTRQVTGLLTLAGEADWYHLEGYLSGNQATVRLESDAWIDLRVCAFVTCAQPEVTLDCGNVVEEDGRLGCCDVDDLFMPLHCPTEDPIELYLRVDGGEACTPYTLEYRL